MTDSTFHTEMKFGLAMRQHFDVLNGFLAHLAHGMSLAVIEEPVPDEPDMALAALMDKAREGGLPVVYGSGTTLRLVIPPGPRNQGFRLLSLAPSQ